MESRLHHCRGAPHLAGYPPPDGWLGHSAFVLTKRTCWETYRHLNIWFVAVAVQRTKKSFNELQFTTVSIPYLGVGLLKRPLLLLQIAFEFEKAKSDVITMMMVAPEVTWLHQRRRRRQAQRSGVDAQSTETFPDSNVDRSDYATTDAIPGQNVQQESADSSTAETTSFSLDVSTVVSTSGDGAETCVQESAVDAATNSIMPECVRTAEKRPASDLDKDTASDKPDASNAEAVKHEPETKRRKLEPEVDGEAEPWNSNEARDNCEAETPKCSDKPEREKTDQSTSCPDHQTQGCLNDFVAVEDMEGYVFKSSLTLKKDDDKIRLEMLWIDGQSKESLHQVMQQFKNRLK